jgi:hypothetical protein
MKTISPLWLWAIFGGVALMWLGVPLMEMFL